MSIFSDYKVGALSEVEFHNACVEMNARDRWERDHMNCYDECYEEFDEDDCIDCPNYEECKQIYEEEL